MMAVQEIRPGDSNFTPLRLLLAMLVVLGHYRLIAGEWPVHWPFVYAEIAVDCFFVISGYLIIASYDRDSVLGSFYIKRFFRIYPLYIMVVLFQTALLVMLAPGAAMADVPSVLSYLASNAVFMNFLPNALAQTALVGLHVPTLNPSLWTLKIEVGFYIIAPLVWYCVRRFGPLVLVAIFVASAAFHWGLIAEGMPVLARQLPGQMRFFVLGIAMYHFRPRLVVSRELGCALAFCLGAAVTAMAYKDMPIVYPISIAATVFLLTFGLPIIPLQRDVSYGVYLLHGPVLQVAFLFGGTRLGLAGLAGLLVLIVGLALLTERAIEAPAINLGRTLSAMVRRRRPALLA